MSTSAIINGSTLEVVQDDITKQDVEAIVNAANDQLTLGGGVAKAILDAAGQELQEECNAIGHCGKGKAVLTDGYELPADYVIHTVGPVYSGSDDDPELLRSCYENSLKLAEENGIRSVAFPAISTGTYGYPVEEAAEIALSTVVDGLTERDIKLVRFVLFSESDYQIHATVLEQNN